MCACVCLYECMHSCIHLYKHVAYTHTLYCHPSHPAFVIQKEAAERLALFTAEEEIFAFQRTVSRIMEMQTEKYWKEGDRSDSKKPT